jgi:uncharacterized protein (DUF849 family)
MSRPVIITCALTDGGERSRRHPSVPITPTQIAVAAKQASQAGAAVVHIHVRDPQTGAGSRDPALYRETVTRIRDAGTAAVINLTGGMGGKFVPFNADRSDLVDGLSRIVHVEELLPDICSLDCGTFNYGSGDETYTAGQSVLLGGHIRVGLEDNLYMSRGSFASNGELVERAVRIVEALGERPAVPQEARNILGLRGATLVPTTEVR